MAAKGITIEGSATFFIVGCGQLPVGTVFTALSNTARTPISGFFAGLPDGATIVCGSNTFQVSYEGGDGNDFTLTVVQ